MKTNKNRVFRQKKAVAFGIGMIILLLLIGFFLLGKKTSSTNKSENSRSTTNGITASQVAKKLKFKYVDYNHYGWMWITTKAYTDRQLTFTVKANGSLRNGEKVTMTLPKSFIKKISKPGRPFIGSRKFSTTVSGLPYLNDVNNVTEFLRFNSNAADRLLDLNSGLSKFSSKKLIKAYIFSYNPISSYNEYESRSSRQDSLGQMVPVHKPSHNDNDFSDSMNITAAGLYEVTAVDGGKKTFKLIGYDDLTFKGKNLDIDSIGTGFPIYADFPNVKSLSRIEKQLEKDGEVLPQ